MFFNTDILYRNGPLALVWLAGNGDAIMKSGPTGSKYKTDIMGADILRLIEIILEQIPSVGCNNGLSLKKIVCLFHGIVVIHHMQLDASLKRLNRLYLETCKMTDLAENEIDTVVPACTNLVPKMPKCRKLPNTSSDFQLQEAPCSPRALPQPFESETFGFGEISGLELEEMIADENRIIAENRRNKRKKGDVDLNEDIPAKLPRHLERDPEPINLRQLDSEPLEDWNPEDFPPFGALVNNTTLPAAADPPILEDTGCDNAVINENPTTENLELELETRDVNISPENRLSTGGQNLLPLRPIQKENELEGKQRRKSKRSLFNEETELSASTISNQVKAALGLDGRGANFFELQRKVSSLHAPTKTDYFRGLKGLQCIENAGRKTDGVFLSMFKNNILSNAKNYRREIMDGSVEEVRAGEDSNISKDSRAIVTRSLMSPNVSDANDNEAQINVPPLKTPQPVIPVEPEMMETVAGHDIPDEMVAPMDEYADLRQDMVIFSAKAKLPPNQDSMPHSDSDSGEPVDESFLLGAFKGGRAKFPKIFPPSKCTRLQAVQGFMLLLRMQGEKKIVMTQSQPKKNEYYGPISVRVLDAN